VGNCFGVGYPPFELSAEGTIALKEHLELRVPELEKYIQDLESGRITFVEIGGRGINNSDPKWDNTKILTIQNMKSSIRSIGMDIKILSNLISSWKLQPLPEPGKYVKVWKD
jgi:hypothetical protein